MALDLAKQIRLDDPLFMKTAACIILAPTIWNIVARTEYYFKPLRTILRNKYIACYVIAAWVFGFSCYRDWTFHEMMKVQPQVEVNSAVQIAAGAFVVVGQILVLSSFYRLGVTGTFLGDYCGIYMDAPVTAFPFSVTSSPMYDGSTMSFLGTSLWHGSPAGVALTVLIYVVYKIAAIYFEDPFTTMIYSTKKD